MCGCSSSSNSTALLPSPCDDPVAPGLERTRFYPRMLVGPADLTQDQIYFREKMRRHNCMIHGWGVVCGLEVSLVPNQDQPCKLYVHGGYAIGPYGDEIVVPDKVEVDICRMGSGEIQGCCPDDYDPWCSDTRALCVAGTKYLAIRYAECLATPVRSYGGGCGCGCDESSCEYSRMRDSYAFKLLTELPESYRNPWRLPTDPCNNQNKVRSCPPCPKDPWVILATLSVSAQCTLTGSINCVNHRRYVVTHAGSEIICRTGGGVVHPFPPGLWPWPGSRLPHVILDLGLAERTESPGAMIGMKNKAGVSMMLPLSADLIPDSPTTIAKFLDRHGDRRLVDPELGAPFTLRELFESSGVPEGTTIRDLSSLVAVLGDRPYRIGEIHETRAEISRMIGSGGVDRLADEKLALHESAKLPTEVLGSPEVPGKVLAIVGKMPIEKLAALTKAELAARVTRGAKGEEKEALKASAESLRNRARTIVDLAKNLPGR